MLWQPRSRPRTVLAHADMTPGSAAILGDELVYLGPNGRNLSGHTVGGDCWKVPLTGGTPKAVTHTALALGCAARGDHVVWSQHIDPKTPNPPELGIADDPWSLWSEQSAPGARPVSLHVGYNQAYSLAVTDHALVWQSMDSPKVVVTDLDDRTRQATIPGVTNPRQIAAGPDDLVAYAITRGGKATVGLVRVT